MSDANDDDGLDAYAALMGSILVGDALGDYETTCDCVCGHSSTLHHVGVRDCAGCACRALRPQPGTVVG